MSASLARLRLITFDVTNTLLQFRQSRTKQYGDIGALFGVLCDDNQLPKNFKKNWYAMNESYPNFGRNSQMEWQSWWHQLIERTFADTGAKIPEEKRDTFCNHLIELYKTSLCWQQCNNSVDILKYMSKIQQKRSATDSLVLGVIANFDPRLQTLLHNMKLADYFQFVLNSYDCNVEKPQKEIFDMAMQSSKIPNLKAEQCLHIGDGPITDYLAAKGAGWHAVLVHEKNPPALIAKYGNQIDQRFVFSSLYDFHKKLLNDDVSFA